MEMWDLYKVQRLMLESQLHGCFGLFPTLIHLLSDTQSTVHQCENSIIYVMDWTACQEEWSLDFKPIKEKRRNMLSDDHLCKLLQPFIQEIPIAGEGSEAGSDGID
jgi:hypothetical protein